MKIGLGVLIFATAALSVASTQVVAQPRYASVPSWGGNTRDCVSELRRGDRFAAYTENQNSLQDIADVCREVGNRERGVNAARAKFYSGRASRMLASYSARESNLAEAIRLLEGAVSAGPEFLAPGPNPRRCPTPGYFDSEQRAATLELVDAYRQSERFAQARQRLNTLSRDDPAVAYQRAMLTLSDRTVGDRQSRKDGAFNELRSVFIRSTQSLQPRETNTDRRNCGGDQSNRLSDSQMRNGRALLFALGRELGRTALDDQTGTNDRARAQIQGAAAINYLTAAADVVAVSGDEGWQVYQPEPDAAPSLDPDSLNPPSLSRMADVYFWLGDARLRSAGVAPRRNGPVLDCFVGARARPGDSASQIQQARNAFEAVTDNEEITGGSRANAYWGLGCATLAGLPERDYKRDLGRAIDELNLATRQEGSENRPIHLLTLADALFIQDGGREAREKYDEALRLLTGSAFRELRSEIHADIARTHLFLNCTPEDVHQRGCIGLRNPSPIDLIASGRGQASSQGAIDALNAALRESGANGDARLLLAQVHMRNNDWDSARDQLDVLLGVGQREDSPNELQEDDQRKSFARYLSSYRETQIRQVCLAANANSRRCDDIGDGRLAKADAVRAATNDQSNPDYRLQACIALIQFNRDGDDHFCRASDLQDPEALLLEGMYWLRRAHDARQGVMQDRWRDADRAFERGASLPASSESPRNYPYGLRGAEIRLSLHDLLEYGERYVDYCAFGGGSFGPTSTAVEDYFHRSGILLCVPRN